MADSTLNTNFIIPGPMKTDLSWSNFISKRCYKIQNEENLRKTYLMIINDHQNKLEFHPYDNKKKKFCIFSK